MQGARWTHETLRVCRAALVLALALALALATAAGAVPTPIPTVRLQETWPLDPRTRGLSKAYFATTADGQHLYKPNARVVHGSGRVLGTHMNFEGELLSTRILQTVGVMTPDTDVVDVKPKGRFSKVTRQLRSRLVDEKTLGTTVLYRNTEVLPRDARIDLRALRRMQLTDVILGNADRHWANIWFYAGADGVLKPLAIDHNFALGDRALAPDFSDGSAFSRPPLEGTGGRRRFTRTTGTVLTRNSIYKGALFDPDGHAMYRAEARHLQRTLTDAELRKLVDGIPEHAFTSADPKARRVELYDQLRLRRDSLGDVVDDFFRTAPPSKVGTKGATVATVATLTQRGEWWGAPWVDAPAIRRPPVAPGDFGTKPVRVGEPSFEGLEQTGQDRSRSSKQPAVEAGAPEAKAKVKSKPTLVKPKVQAKAKVRVHTKVRLRGIR